MAKNYKTHSNPNPNGRPLIDCLICNQRKENHAKGMCYLCYKKQYISKTIICASCKRECPHQGKGYCKSCYNKIFHYNTHLKHRAKKQFGLTLEEYESLITACVSCDFDKVIELHHLDGDKNNNAKENLVPLCPNCHRMIHHRKYYNEILANLMLKGVKTKNIRHRRLPEKYGDKLY